MEWTTPTLTDVPCGMEVTTYRSAELDPAELAPAPPAREATAAPTSSPES